jgi:hypothetical protein
MNTLGLAVETYDSQGQDKVISNLKERTKTNFQLTYVILHLKLLLFLVHDIH